MTNGGAHKTTTLVQVLRNLPVEGLLHAKVLGGIRDFTPAELELRLGELRIVHQRRSRNDVGEPGQLRLGKRLFDSLDCVFLSIHRFRVLHEGDGDSRRAVCASCDNLLPLPELLAPRAKRCNDLLPSGQVRPVCGYAQWDDDPATGKRVPPPCAEGIVFMGLTFDTPPSLFWFPLSKTARIDAQTFLNELNQVPHVEHITQFGVHIATQEKRSKGGGVVWFGPTFVLNTLPPELYGAYRELAERLGDVRWIPFVRQEGLEEEPPVDEPERGGSVVETTVQPASDAGIPFITAWEWPEPEVRV